MIVKTAVTGMALAALALAAPIGGASLAKIFGAGEAVAQGGDGGSGSGGGAGTGATSVPGTTTGPASGDTDLRTCAPGDQRPECVRR